MKRRIRHQRGFTMMEVVFAMVIFLMMVLVFAAVFPLAVTASKYSNNYNQAVMIAQHKVDQIRQLGGSALTLTAANLTNLGIVNSGSCAADSNSGFACTFTNTDNIADIQTAGVVTSVGYFPYGSTATLTIDPDLSSGVPSGAVQNVIVTVAWSGGGMSSGTYTAATKLVEEAHQ